MKRVWIAVGVLAVTSIVAAGVASGMPTGERAGSTTFGKWDVSVSVAPERFGPMKVEITKVRVEGKKPILRAKLAIRNSGTKAALMKDRYRTSAFARGGEGKQLLVADDGCGYVISDPGDPVDPGFCQADLPYVHVEPGKTTELGLAAWKGLKGMSPLSAGHYEFDRHVSFRLDGKDKRRIKADLVISFDVTAADQSP